MTVSSRSHMHSYTTSKYDFDSPPVRTGTNSSKWSAYGPDVLPLWVADMDFESPPPVIEALTQRVRHGVFGYASPPLSLREAICDRLLRLQNWTVDPEALVFLPGLVSGLNAVTRAIGNIGDGVMVNTPVYPPFLSAPENQSRELQAAPLARSTCTLADKSYIYYEPDLDAMQATVSPSSRLFLLCNPHNPVGRAFSRSELEAIGDFCARHDMIICADEIHCDLRLNESAHLSIAALAPEFEQRSITLLAPSKTYNLPGLGCSVAVIPDDQLRECFQGTIRGIIPHVNVLGLVAAEAAYTHCDEWLVALRQYLTQNRDFVAEYLRIHLPELRYTLPQATYLTWIDCRNLNLENCTTPCEFFLNEARVALNDGRHFGDEGKGFVRLNFGSSRQLLEEALDRMTVAVRKTGVRNE